MPNKTPNIMLEIPTDRLVLRSFRNEDATAAFEMVVRNKPRLQNDFPKLLSKAVNVAGVEGVIEERRKAWAKSYEFFFAIHRREFNAVIGQVSLKSINWKSGKAELAYFIDEEHARKGYATEALHGIIEWCFDAMELNSLFLRAALDNKPSQKLAEKVGFTKQGIVPKDHKRQDGKLVDIYYYTITPKEYEVWKAL